MKFIIILLFITSNCYSQAYKDYKFVNITETSVYSMPDSCSDTLLCVLGGSYIKVLNIVNNYSEISIQLYTTTGISYYNGYIESKYIVDNPYLLETKYIDNSIINSILKGEYFIFICKNKCEDCYYNRLPLSELYSLKH